DKGYPAFELNESKALAGGGAATLLSYFSERTGKETVLLTQAVIRLQRAVRNLQGDGHAEGDVERLEDRRGCTRRKCGYIAEAAATRISEIVSYESPGEHGE